VKFDVGAGLAPARFVKAKYFFLTSKRTINQHDQVVFDIEISQEKKKILCSLNKLFTFAVDMYVIKL
jgi:hypothetical protein